MSAESVSLRIRIRGEKTTRQIEQTLTRGSTLKVETANGDTLCIGFGLPDKHKSEQQLTIESTAFRLKPLQRPAIRSGAQIVGGYNPILHSDGKVILPRTGAVMKFSGVVIQRTS